MRVMQETYGIPEIVRGTAGGLRGHSPTLASELDEMAIEVDSGGDCECDN
jgi:hypothetical protein